MKRYLCNIAVLISMLAFAACSEESFVDNATISDENVILNDIRITGTDFEYDGNTRSSVSITESGATFTWNTNDTVGIFPNQGDQVSFAMQDGTGTQTATFSGGGWALKSSSTYAAYYPFNFYNRDLTKIPVCYNGQTQNGNANTDHIGAYDFMAASVATPSNGSVAFDMKHLGCLVQVKVNLEEAATLTKLAVKSGNDSKEFIISGYIDLTSAIPSIVQKSYDDISNALNINLNNFTVNADETATFYFMIAPLNLDGEKMEFFITKDNGDIKTYQTDGKNFVAGKAYSFTLTSENEVDFSWLSSNRYISYVENYEMKYSGDNIYQYSSYIKNPVGIIGKIEMKFKMVASNQTYFLCCGNDSRYHASEIYMGENRIVFQDNEHEFDYTWEELQASHTDCLILTASFNDKYIQLNDLKFENPMTGFNAFSPSYLFTYYYGESDDGYWLELGKGVPEGSKLYYVKIWDVYDNLVYVGGASISVNPKTGNEEYCWRSYYIGVFNYEFAHYSTTLSSYTPYGGGVD